MKKTEKEEIIKETQALKNYFDRKEFIQIEQLRGAVLIFIFLFAFLTMPVTLVKTEIGPYIALVLISIIHYGIIYKRLSIITLKNKNLIVPFKYFQSIINLILITVLIHLTGGMESYFTFVYIFDIITSGFLLSWKESFLTASMGWIFYLLMLYLEKLDIITHISIWPNMGNLYLSSYYIFSYAFKLMIILYVASFIAGYINAYIIKNMQKINKMTYFISKITNSLSSRAINDIITNLYDFNYFKLRVYEEILKARSFETQLALIYLNINDFEIMADKYGMAFANKMLKEAARKINIFMSRYDLASRVSAAEFIILVVNAKENDVSEKINKIKKKIEEIDMQIKTKEPIKIVVTSGWVTYPEDAQSAEIFIEKSRQALNIAENIEPGYVYRYKGELDRN